MLLIRPDIEQGVRNRITVMRETIGEDIEDPELAKQREELDKLEKQLREFETREDFKKIAKEYWSSNEVQLSTMAQVLQEMGAEIERMARSAEDANKLNKMDIASSFEKRKGEFSSIGEKLLEFVPAGERTGELVMRVSGSWEKLKGVGVMIEFLQGMVSETEDESVAISKKLATEGKKMAKL